MSRRNCTGAKVRAREGNERQADKSAVEAVKAVFDQPVVCLEHSCGRGGDDRAEKPSDAVLQDIKASLKDVAKAEVDLDLRIDPSLIGGIVVLVMMCLDGTPGPNRYGPDPKAGERGGAPAAEPVKK